MSQRRTTAFVWLSVLLVSASVPAAEIHVPADAPTIQAAIDLATNDDHIVVADGVWAGADNRGLHWTGKSLTVRSAGGPAQCVIDCQQADRAFNLLAGGAVAGFTIRNGRAGQGGAIYVGGPATISDCVLEGNTANEGGAIFTATGVDIRRCILQNNHATERDGGALCNLWGHAILHDCLLVDNSAALLGGAIFSDLAALEVHNCTIVANTANQAGGIRNYSGVDMTLTGSIVWGNRDDNGSGLGAQITSVSSGEFVNYCCIQGYQGEFGGVGNINLDPQFVAPDAGDYHLSATSPCINAGIEETPAITPDLDHHPRPLCGRPDIGAYEFGIGDADCDRDVDFADIELLPANLSGPDVSYPSGGESFDFDADADADLRDIGGLLRMFGDA